MEDSVPLGHGENVWMPTYSEAQLSGGRKPDEFDWIKVPTMDWAFVCWIVMGVKRELTRRQLY